jgi:hypothetical protein
MEKMTVQGKMRGIIAALTEYHDGPHYTRDQINAFLASSSTTLAAVFGSQDQREAFARAVERVFFRNKRLSDAPYRESTATLAQVIAFIQQGGQ